MVEPLSPAAQAVLDTMHRSYDHEPTRRALAAGALRAAADQVVPPNGSRRNNEIRAEIRAIAAELDAAEAWNRAPRATTTTTETP